MTEAQRHLRNQLLTKIHTNAEYKNIVKFGGKEAWSEWVYVRFGVVSCKELSISELNLVNGLLQGFLYEKGKKVPCVWDGVAYKPDTKGRAIINPVMITAKQVMQILALQESLGYDNKKLVSFIYRQNKKMIWNMDNLYKLSKKEASKVITGLEKIAVGYVKKKDRKNVL